MRAPAVLRSVVTGCKLAKWGSNNMETPNHFSPIFFSFLQYFWYPMNPKNGMYISEFRSLYEYIILLLFHEMVSYPCGGRLIHQGKWLDSTPEGHAAEGGTPEGRAVSVTRELDLSLLCRIWLFGRHLVSLAKIAEVWPPFF